LLSAIKFTKMMAAQWERYLTDNRKCLEFS
jgi:hypothetical protein